MHVKYYHGIVVYTNYTRITVDTTASDSWDMMVFFSYALFLTRLAAAIVHQCCPLSNLPSFIRFLPIFYEHNK